MLSVSDNSQSSLRLVHTMIWTYHDRRVNVECVQWHIPECTRMHIMQCARMMQTDTHTHTNRARISRRSGWRIMCTDIGNHAHARLRLISAQSSGTHSNKYGCALMFVYYSGCVFVFLYIFVRVRVCLRACFAPSVRVIVWWVRFLWVCSRVFFVCTHMCNCTIDTCNFARARYLFWYIGFNCRDSIAEKVARWLVRKMIARQQQKVINNIWYGFEPIMELQFGNMMHSWCISFLYSNYSDALISIQRTTAYYRHGVNFFILFCI